MLFLILYLTLFTNSEALLGLKLSYNLTLPAATQQALGYPRDNYLYFTQKVEENGFKAVEHQVRTEDGYLLKLFEVTSPDCEEFKKLPVLMVHGVLFNSDIFLVAGPNSSLAYLLAKDCHDVFVGNVRGNDHGRQHVSLNPDVDAKFWDFSQTEYGKYDVTAMIDHVLESTGAEKLNYLGYSQGCGVFILSMSVRPENNDKVEQAVLLAPALNLHYTRSPAFDIIFNAASFFKPLTDLIGIYEVLFKGSILQTIAQLLCHDITFTKPFCEFVISTIDSYYPGELKDEVIENVVAIFPVGVSIKLLNHYQQLRFKNLFRDYNYGTVGNIVRYGSPNPPDFNTDNIKVPTTLVAGANDIVITVEEVKYINNLIKDSKMVVVEDPSWNHIDQVLSSRIADQVYPIVKENFGDS